MGPQLLALSMAETRLFIRDRSALFWSFVFPALMLFLFGSLLGNDVHPEFGNRGFIDVFVPGLIAIAILSTAFFSIAAALVDYRERGVLRTLSVTPLAPTTFISAHILTNYVLLGVVVLVLLVLAQIGYGARAASIGTLAAAFTLGTVSFFAQAFIVASLVRSARTATAIAMVCQASMMSLSGAIMPVEVFSERVQLVSRFIPLTYVVELLRDAWAGQSMSASLVEIGVLAACGAAGLIVAARYFRWE
jgi:ABC-2 type transport system permease protein